MSLPGTSRRNLVLALLAVATVTGLLVGQVMADKPDAPASKEKPKPRPVPVKVNPPARPDLHGDPLPVGALARLGTVRFRYNATSIAYSPSGKIIALGGADNQIRLFDAATGKEIRRLAGHQPRKYNPPFNPRSPFDALVSSVGPGNVTCLAFSPTGKVLASGGWDDTVRLWDVDTGAEIRTIFAHKAMVAAVVFAPNGKSLASRGGIDGIIRIWDPATGNEVRNYQGLSKVNPWRFNRSAGLAFSPDGQTLAAGDMKVIHFWDVGTGKENKKLDAHPACICVAYSRDGKLLASSGIDGKDKHSIRIWDVAEGKELRRCRLPKDEPPIDLAFAPDQKQLAAVVEEDDVHLFDVATGKPVHRLKHYWASRLAYDPRGNTLVTARGPTLRLWNSATGKELHRELAGHRAGVGAVAFAPDGKLIASGGDHINVWEAATGKLRRQIPVPGHIAALAFSAKDGTLASAGRDRAVHLWNVDTGKETRALTGHKHMLCGLAISPDGKLLASGDAQSTIRIWDLAAGKTVHEIDLQSGAEALSLAFSPDGKTLACGGAWNDSSFLPRGIINIQGVKMTRKEGYYVLQWDVTTGKEVRRFAGLQAKIKAIAFSPDGRFLAGSARDGKLCLWDAVSAQDRLHIVAHPSHDDAAFSTTPSLAFSVDGKRLFSASTDKTIRVWDAATAREVGQIRSPDGGFLSLALAPDGKTLASGSTDTTALVWSWQAAIKVKAPGKPKVIYIR